MNTLAWNCDGGYLATGSDDKTARVYNVDGSGAVKPLMKLDVHADAVVKLCWDPTSPQRVATVGGWKDKAVRVWDLRLSSKPAAVFKLQEEYINLAWSPDGRTLAAGSENAEAGDSNSLNEGEKDCITLIDVRKLGGGGKASSRPTLKFPFQVEDFCFSPNSRFLIMTTESGTVEVQQCDQTQESGANPNTDAASTGALAPLSAAPPPASPAAPAKKKCAARSFRAHAGNCSCVAVDPSQLFLAVGSKDSLVSMWDLRQLVAQRSLGHHTTAIRSLSFAPLSHPLGSSSGHPGHASHLLASTSYDTVIDVSDVRSGRQTHAIDAGCSVKQVAWQPVAGSRLLAVARDAKKDDKDEQATRARYNRSDFVFLATVPKTAATAASSRDSHRSQMDKAGGAHSQTGGARAMAD